MNNLKLFVVLLGGKPEGRKIEQHDIFVGAAEELKDLVPDMELFWPNVELHIDGYIAFNHINEYMIEFQPRIGNVPLSKDEPKLYFINLGGYKSLELEEYHKKLFIVAKSLSEAVSKAKEDQFYLEGQNDSDSRSHVDDKEAIDDIICISETLRNYKISLVKIPENFFPFSERKIGYLAFSKL